MWLNGESIRTEIDSNIVFSEIEKNDKNIYSLLFFSGYLKCVNKELIEKTYHCDLAIPNKEAVYHAFLLGILISLNDYEVISNRESGLGRVDIILLHKENKSRLAIIMELKTIDEFEEETKEKALDKALKQIEDKKYEVEVKKRGYSHILKMGVVFDGKRVWVKLMT